MASSFSNRAVQPGTAVFGEVGLAGEVRAITQAALRVREAAQMGFLRCVLPHANVDACAAALGGGFELVGARSVTEALDRLLS